MNSYMLVNIVAKLRTFGYNIYQQEESCPEKPPH
jgi:hypothetical protein